MFLVNFWILRESIRQREKNERERNLQPHFKDSLLEI